MAGKGGARPGAGRKKGSMSKANIAVQEKLKKLGCDPIEGMAIIAMEAKADGDRVLAGNMYKELAQYQAPKLKSIEMTGADGADLVPKSIKVVYE